MKLVIQFFNEKDGTRSEALSGSPAELIKAFENVEASLNQSIDDLFEERSQMDPESDLVVDIERRIHQAQAALDSYVDSFVIVILEQHSDDADDMRVSRIPVLTRKNFINVLKEKK